uniref:Uncharacterized protein n=1 Tax=Arundo donax TaxID=35708 RepID=A0A0A9GY15_ARUDO
MSFSFLSVSLTLAICSGFHTSISVLHWVRCQICLSTLQGVLIN